MATVFSVLKFNQLDQRFLKNRSDVLKVM